MNMLRSEIKIEKILKTYSSTLSACVCVCMCLCEGECCVLIPLQPKMVLHSYGWFREWNILYMFFGHLLYFWCWCLLVGLGHFPSMLFVGCGKKNFPPFRSMLLCNFLLFPKLFKCLHHTFRSSSRHNVVCYLDTSLKVKSYRWRCECKKKNWFEGIKGPIVLQHTRKKKYNNHFFFCCFFYFILTKG